MRRNDLRPPLGPPEPDWSTIAQRLRRLALAFTGGDRHRAEDLCQATLARILAKAPQDADHFGLARRTMVRIWLDEQRSLRRRLAQMARLALTRPATAPPPSPESVDREELLGRVRESIDRLPARQRAVLIMRLVEELDYEGIAAAVGCTVAAARSNLHLARQRIRQELGEEP